MKKNFYSEILPALFLSLVLISTVCYFYLRTARDYQMSFEKVKETQQRINALNDIYTDLNEIESGSRGYIITNDSAYLGDYLASEKEIYDDLEMLRKDHLEEKRSLLPLDSLEAAINQKLSSITKAIDLMKKGARNDAFTLTNTGVGRLYMSKIRSMTDKLKDLEQEVLILHYRDLNVASGKNFMAILIDIVLTVILLTFWVLKLVSTNGELFNRNQVLAQTQREIADTNAQLRATKNELESTNNNLEKLVDERTAALTDSERRMKFLADFMPQLVWGTEPNGFHDYFNQRWFEYSGLDFEKSCGEGWLQVLHPDDLDRAIVVWNGCLASGQPYEIEYRLRRHDGQYRWFLGRALPMLNEEKQIIKWFGTCTDIEDQKNTNRQLEKKVQERTTELVKANQELLRSNAELEQFAYVASHDLQEPLRKIHSFGERLEMKYKDALTDEGLDFLFRMRGASTRMQVLIDDLLNFSRVSRVKNPFEPQDLNRLLKEVISNLEEPIRNANVVIEMDNLPTINGDHSQLLQLFQNLLSNAIKFTTADTKPFIKITCQLANEEQSSLFDLTESRHKFYLISIIDNGIGFDPKYAEKIFTIFQRLHGRTEFPGTGIGLAICKKVVENHGGSIKAISQIGKGATFQILLPA